MATDISSETPAMITAMDFAGMLKVVSGGREVSHCGGQGGIWPAVVGGGGAG